MHKNQKKPRRAKKKRREIDPKLVSEVGSYSEQDFVKLVKNQFSQDEQKLIKNSWISEIWHDPELTNFPVMNVLGKIEGQLRYVKSLAGMVLLEGLLLPGTDAIKFRSRKVEYKGWRPVLITPSGKIINLTVWGRHVNLWSEREINREQRLKIDVPLFHMVKIMCKENKYDTSVQIGTTEQGSKVREELKGKINYEFKFLKEVSDSPITNKELAAFLSMVSREPSTLGVNDAYEPVVVTGRINFIDGLDEWVESNEQVTQIPKVDNQGRPVMTRDPIFGGHKQVMETKKQRIKSETGQQLIQPRIDNDNEKMICFRLSLIDEDESEDNEDRQKYCTVTFTNNKYADTYFAIIGWTELIKTASLRPHDGAGTGINPFSVLRNALNGHVVDVLGALSKIRYDDVNNEESKVYLVVQGAALFTSYLTSLPNFEELVPLLDEDIPDDIIVAKGGKGKAKPRARPKPKPVVESSDEDEFEDVEIDSGDDEVFDDEEETYEEELERLEALTTSFLSDMELKKLKIKSYKEHMAFIGMTDEAIKKVPKKSTAYFSTVKGQYVHIEKRIKQLQALIAEESEEEDDEFLDDEELDEDDFEDEDFEDEEEVFEDDEEVQEETSEPSSDDTDEIKEKPIIVEGYVSGEYNTENYCAICDKYKNNVSTGSAGCFECDHKPIYNHLDLQEKKKDELKSIAKGHGIKGIKRKKKDELIDILMYLSDAQEEEMEEGNTDAPPLNDLGKKIKISEERMTDLRTAIVATLKEVDPDYTANEMWESGLLPKWVEEENLGLVNSIIDEVKAKK